MAVENPNLQPAQVANFRRPETGDPRAIARAVGQVADIAIEGLKDYNENKLVGELEQERQRFLDQPLDLTTEEDVFSGFTGEDPPTDKDLQLFADRLTRLTRARKSGQISETELKIRQEQILREHMARKPWMADELLQAASRSQGYNPIGSAVEAVIAAQESEARAQKDFWDKINSQIIGLGIDSTLLYRNPVEFYRQGTQAIAAAQELQTLRNAVETGDLKDKLVEPQIQEAFVSTMEKGFLATLNSRVIGFVNQVNSVPYSVYSTTPELQNQFDKQKTAIAYDYRTGGPQWQAMRAEAKRLVPTMTDRQFNQVYETTVKPYFEMMADARTPEEARAQVNFYADADYRALLQNNPTLAVNLGLVKALDGLKDTPEALLLGRNLSNQLTQDLGRIWGNQGAYTNDAGEVLPVPGNRPGQQQDLEGDGVKAEAARIQQMAAATRLLDDVTDSNPRDLRGSSQQGLAALSSIAETMTWNRENNVNRPSRAFRNQFLGTLSSEKVSKALASVPATYAQVVQRTVLYEVDELTTDIAYSARMAFTEQGGRLAWKNAEWLDVEVTNAGARIKVKKDAPELVKRQLGLVADAFNNQYGADLRAAYGAARNLQSFSGSYAVEDEVINNTFRYRILMGLGLVQ